MRLLGRQLPVLVKRLHVLRPQRVLHRAALGRVEDKHRVKEVERLRRRFREDFCPRPARLDRERAQELHRLLIGDACEVLLARGAEDVDDQPQLVEVVAAGKERLPPNHLGKYTAHSPHIDRRRVRLVFHKELGRAVPARHNVLGQPQVLLLRIERVDGARQTKIADLEITVLVHEEVAGLQVSVQHVRRVDGVHAAQDLVEEVLEVLI
mmetsp:Transcript_22332/g.50434  ORF Transcript_22332/g.50434 Transcript_22332/m.50434 type:complete len:209 (-) Transcript_22332:438-1064(-)